jgi:hypothetical protein
MIAQNIPFKNILNAVIGWRNVMCEVMTTMKNTVFWVMTTYSLVEFEGHFRGSEECLQGQRVNQASTKLPCLVHAYILFSHED